MKKRSKCNYRCVFHKKCDRYDGRGSNLRAYCLPDFLRYGFVEKVK
jgi:hypothetical protein